MWNQRNNRSLSELDEVTTDKSETPIRQSEATDATPVSQQSLPDLQMRKGKLKQI